MKKQPTCIRTPENIQVLEQLLQARKWREADLKTYEIMLAVTKRKAVGHLDSPSIESFPCPELQAIDRLWQQESGGLWGLGVQKEIYQRAGNRPSSEESQTYNLDAYVQFNDLVRWIQTSDNGKESWKPAEQHIFSLDAPEGHLPRLEQ
ncbi:MAG: GUN4 domain-containing protein [Microcoleaceae cyanobacterium]